jgi:hypothetical protein
MAPYRSPLASPAEMKMVGVGIDYLILERIHTLPLLGGAKECTPTDLGTKFSAELAEVCYACLHQSKRHVCRHSPEKYLE